MPIKTYIERIFLMHKKIGFIGCGNMAKAIIGGIVSSGFADPDHVLASNRSIPKLIEMKETYHIKITQDNKMVAIQSNILFLSVTPDAFSTIIEEIRDDINNDTVVVSIAAGLTISDVEGIFGKNLKIVKAMPNTPVLVGGGMTAISVNEFVTDEEKLEIKSLFESFGKAEFIEESVMDIASAVGGSSPAFVYMFIEALADSAVMYGMPRELAYTVSAQAVLGSAKMVLDTGIHPGILKDEVCSPGGTTIQSVVSLEKDGFRAAIMNAVKANLDKMNGK